MLPGRGVPSTSSLSRACASQQNTPAHSSHIVSDLLPRSEPVLEDMGSVSVGSGPMAEYPAMLPEKPASSRIAQSCDGVDVGRLGEDMGRAACSSGRRCVTELKDTRARAHLRRQVLVLTLGQAQWAPLGTPGTAAARVFTAVIRQERA
ncbi:hypothetical protein PSPO01_03590 [Paraphaeosphaeria sporulosa]